MKPEIQHYLNEHGSTYTEPALRKALLDAGHDPADVDAGIAEWEAGNAHAGSRGTAARGQFTRWSLLLHVATLLVVFVLILLAADSAGGVLPFGLVLAIVLAIGWAISWLIGRTLLSRTSLMVALIAPVISALLIGGTCFALANSLRGAPHRSGTIQVSISGDFAFNGSGAATCTGDPAGDTVNVAAEIAGVDGGSLSIQAYVIPGQPSITISKVSADKEGTERDWSGPPGQITFSGTKDDGRISFDALPGQSGAVPGESGAGTPEPLAGSVSWACG